MKKWLAACLLAMALLFVTTAAMAGHTNPVTGNFCEGGKYTFFQSETNATQHKYHCGLCSFSDWENHWAQDGRGATCTEKATCGGCYREFGNFGDHDYGDWMPNGNGTHTHTCKRK